jgi:hypothetical protein
MRGRVAAVSLTMAIALCAACRHALPPLTDQIPGLKGATRVVTLTNLHPDEERVTLYSGNFQQAGLIPICSEVVLDYGDPTYLYFTVVATGKQYGYYDHPVAAEPLLQNATRYFGRDCPQAELDKLTPVEKEGLRLGIAKKGMRKEAVILACGYPPLRDTPALDLKTWRYWSSRWRYFTVTFDDQGVVAKVDYL